MKSLTMFTNYCPDYRFGNTSSFYHHICLFNTVCKLLLQPLLLRSYSAILCILYMLLPLCTGTYMCTFVVGCIKTQLGWTKNTK